MRNKGYHVFDTINCLIKIFVCSGSIYIFLGYIFEINQFILPNQNLKDRVHYLILIS